VGLLEQVFEAGVVGAGGAGFPTHKKLTQVDLLIVNAAECEPLLASDRYVMRTFPDQIIDAVVQIRETFGIPRVVIGTKRHYAAEVKALQDAIGQRGGGIELFLLDSFYPAGDEQVLIYEITGQTVPPGGIPLQVGIVVVNVTTALNIHRATQGKPVTRHYVTVTGEVAQPCLVDAPIGATAADLIAAAGGATVEPYAIVRGGPMMGRRHGQAEVAGLGYGKADGGLIVLPADHPLIQFSQKPIEHVINQAKSICIQCSLCTDMCPRYLIGHQMRPHRVMRSVATGQGAPDLLDALLCCECGICEMYACPMGLSPRRMNIYVKGMLRSQGVGVQDKTVHPEQTRERDYRHIAQQRLIDRWELDGYPTHLDQVVTCEPDHVRLALRHGVGKPSAPRVAVGDKVAVGDVVAGVDFSEAGCLVHASIGGVVTSVDDGWIDVAAATGAGRTS
jgi:Na+-translocating ferredoxin:NAD+ oxidoreductase RnfC subunit